MSDSYGGYDKMLSDLVQTELNILIPRDSQNPVWLCKVPDMCH